MLYVLLEFGLEAFGDVIEGFAGVLVGAVYSLSRELVKSCKQGDIRLYAPKPN